MADSQGRRAIDHQCVVRASGEPWRRGARLLARRRLWRIWATTMSHCAMSRPGNWCRSPGDRLSSGLPHRSWSSYRYGPGVFKVDYALSSPIPWKARGVLALGDRASRRHAGGDCGLGRCHAARARRRAAVCAAGAADAVRSVARAAKAGTSRWAYCHVPNGSTVDMLPRIEAQIERFAPGFRDCVLERRVFSPASLEAMDANLIGGDIGGGLMTLPQFLFRPTRQFYATSARDIFICSSSTPPGRRSSRHVRLQRGETRAETPVTNAPDLGTRGKLAVALVADGGGRICRCGRLHCAVPGFHRQHERQQRPCWDVSGATELDGAAAAPLRHRVLRCGNGVDAHRGGSRGAQQAFGVSPPSRWPWRPCCWPFSPTPRRRCISGRLSISSPLLTSRWSLCWRLPWEYRPRR